MIREAPAKVNLYLKVLGRRPDGWHELDSVMARLTLADRIELDLGAVADSLTAVTNLPGGLPPDFFGSNNLALKAVRLFREWRGWPGPTAIFIEKNIPWGAGLGGGSSDGAAVLIALNQAAPEPLPAKRISELGLALGSDVPFFLATAPLLRAAGVGERLGPAPTSFAAFRGRKILLVKPSFELATARVFKKLALTNDSANNSLGRLLEPVPGWNDLLVPALSLAPVLTEITRFLASFQSGTWGLSGSGPTFWLDRPQPETVTYLTRLHPDWWVRETSLV